jgi:hypothetical protein
VLINVKLRRDSITIIAVAKQEILRSLCMCVCVCGGGGLSYPARKAHAPCYIVICGLSVSYFYTLSHKLHDSRKKKLFNITCVFRFSLQLMSESFFILRIIQ